MIASTHSIVPSIARGGLLLACFAAAQGFAEVTKSDVHGFVSAHEVEIAVPPERVYQALVAEVGDWWDPAHTYSGDAANMSFNEFPALWERLGEEGFVHHMAIDMVRPPRTLRLRGGLGPLQTLAVVGSMTFDLEATQQAGQGDGPRATKLAYRYVVNGRELQDWAEPVDRVMGQQLERLRHYVETGEPTPPPEGR